MIEHATERRDNKLIELLIKEVQDMRQELKDHQTREKLDLQELKDAFNTAKSVVWFVKWSAGIVGTLAVSWIFLKEHFIFGVK
jgi:hypothetical protein